MMLGAFGDSFLFGSDLGDIQDHDSIHLFIPSQQTYPALIADKLNLDYYCTALPAQGNKVIADDILRAVNYHGNKMFYIINWTWIDRFEFLGTSRVGNFDGWESTLPGDNKKTYDFYYKHFYKDLDAKLSNLMYINSALDSLLQNNCKFIMTYMDYLIFDQQHNSSASIEYLQDKVKPYTNDYNNVNFLDWAKNNNFEISDHWHPLEEAHKVAADYWLPKVRTLLNSSAKEDYLHAFI